MSGKTDIRTSAHGGNDQNDNRAQTGGDVQTSGISTPTDGDQDGVGNTGNEGGNTGTGNTADSADTSDDSRYMMTGQPKAAASTTTTLTTQVSNKNANASKKQTVTATAGDTLPQARDEPTAVMPVVALSAAAAAAAIYLARRRMQE